MSFSVDSLRWVACNHGFYSAKFFCDMMATNSKFKDDVIPTLVELAKHGCVPVTNLACLFCHEFDEHVVDSGATHHVTVDGSKISSGLTYTGSAVTSEGFVVSGQGGLEQPPCSIHDGNTTRRPADGLVDASVTRAPEETPSLSMNEDFRTAQLNDYSDHIATESCEVPSEQVVEDVAESVVRVSQGDAQGPVVGQESCRSADGVVPEAQVEGDAPELIFNPFKSSQIWLLSFFSIARSLWLSRNDVTFKGYKFDVNQNFKLSIIRLSWFCKAKWSLKISPSTDLCRCPNQFAEFVIGCHRYKPSKLVAPDLNSSKFNLDGTVCGAFIKAGIEVLLRNHLGKILVSFFKSVGVVDYCGTIGSLRSMFFSQLVPLVKFLSYIFESDCSMIVDWIQNPLRAHLFSRILWTCAC
ncbi:hypothetical protein GQ457_10G012500 [Hibiscus cannabinus]